MSTPCEPLRLERRGVDERRVHLDRPQVREDAEPLAQRQQPLLGPDLRRRVVPLRAADGAEQHRVGTPGTRPAPRRSARCRARRWSSRRSAARRSRTRGRAPARPPRAPAAPSPTTSGPMPSPGSRTIFAFTSCLLRIERPAEPDARCRSAIAACASRRDRQAVLDRVDQRAPAGLDDVGARADRAPPLGAVAACRSARA